QDADPVMLDVVQSQASAQQIFVGDRHQAIYEWRGAVNAMRDVQVEDRRWLTMSFRFGPAIAERANEYLEAIHAERFVRGHPGVASTVGPIPDPDAVLVRTNATAVATAIEALDRGKRPALLGGGEDVKNFAIAARQLMARRPTTHPDLSCFDDWGQVQHFVENEEEGSDIAMLVRLVDAWGPDTIIDVVDRCVDERGADLLVSTAHKAKGREWPKVRLAADFPALREDDDAGDEEGKGAGKPPPTPEEIRLAYVAVTRAKLRLEVVEPGSSRPAPRPPLPPPGRPGASLAVMRRRPLAGSRTLSGEIKVGIGPGKPRR
ncbi:MAG: 3'-5' exonuclease, partial [Alphaproteobacteria bacterium]